jgi:predicted extracellular nuclease
MPGGNIRNAFLFDPMRVAFIDRESKTGDHAATAVAGPAVTASPGVLSPGRPEFAGDDGRGWEGARKPLVGEFEFRGTRLIIVNLHLRSKRGDDPPFGTVQPLRRPSEAQRSAQAETIQRFVSRVLDLDPNAAIIVLGDLNDFEFRAPVRALEGTTLVNLTERVPMPERYSYIYQGISQTLDHILVSPALAEDARVEIVHVNADFPVSERGSDHDPVIVRLRVPSPLDSATP